MIDNINMHLDMYPYHLKHQRLYRGALTQCKALVAFYLWQDSLQEQKASVAELAPLLDGVLCAVSFPAHMWPALLPGVGELEEVLYHIQGLLGALSFPFTATRGSNTTES